MTKDNNIVECEETDSMEVLKESNRYRDFEWDQKELYAVVKNDGRYAGIPCTSYDEARQMAANHSGAKVFKLILEDDPSEEALEENLSDTDRLNIVDRVMRGELNVFSSEGEPDSSYIPLPELSSTHGKLTFDYYYDEDSGEVVSYSRLSSEAE